MVYMYKTVASKLSISHIAWHNKEAWCYDKKESYMVIAPEHPVTTKIILNELKKFSFHWYYLEITKSQIYSILFFSIDKFLRSIHCWSFPSFLHHRWTVKGQWWLIWNLYKIFLIKFQKDDKKKNRKRAQRSVYVKYLHVELQVYDSL